MADLHDAEKHTEKRTETHACDLISKAMVCEILADIYPTDGEKIVAVKDIDEAYEKILQLPSAQQDCTDCEDYDSERHYCPRYCETIRRTVEEAKQERTGRWIDAVIPNDNGGLPVQVCDQCNTFFPLAYTGGGHRYCPNCGAYMGGEQNETD